MPTYQYACTVCGHRLEAVQSFTDEPLAECPECAGRLRKQFSAVGVVFKGSGFYRTDSRSAVKSSASSDSSTSTSTDSSSSSSSESKPAVSSSSSSGSKPAASSGAATKSASAA